MKRLVAIKEVRLTKQKIRSKILARLKIQKEEDRKRKSSIIKDKLFRILLFRKARVVMFYIAFDGEVNTQDMVKEAKNLGKIIAVPVCKNDKITLRPCLLGNGHRLQKGPYGVGEPAVKKSIKLKDLDLVIVPGIAFDRRNNRLGRGKGCYDRFLGRLPKRIPSIGLAFDFQILPGLPTTATDVGVQKIISA